MHYSTLFLAPALLSLLVSSGPIPKDDTSSLNAYYESSDFWEKLARRVAAPTTSAPPSPSTTSTATPTPIPTPTLAPNTTAAFPTDRPDPADDPFLYPEPTDDDTVWIPDDDVFIPGFDKRSATVAHPRSSEDDDDDFIYLYDEPEDPVTPRGSNSTDVVGKREAKV